MKKWIGVFLLLTIVSLHAGTESMALLSIPPDAAVLGLGGANQAYNAGAADIFVNPALITRHQHRLVQFSSIPSVETGTYFSAALSIPITADDVAGLGALGTFVSDINEYDADGNYYGAFNHYASAWYLSYAHSFFPFSMGLNIKYFNLGYSGAKTFKNKGSGFGFDIGMLYIFQKVFRFGFIYQNSFDVLWNQNYHDRYPKRLALGLATEPSFWYENFFKYYISFEQVETKPLRMNTGFQLTLLENKMGLEAAYMRVGLGNYDLELRDNDIAYSSFTEANRFYSFGAGLAYKNNEKFGIQIDYTYRLMHILSDQHMITTKFWF